MKCFFSLSLLSLVAVSVPAKAQEQPIWHDTYASGAAVAKEEGKHLFVVFTGTDWIEMCSIFYKEILSHPDFMAQVGKEFVLVKLEYPKDNKLPKQEAMEKSLLRSAYRVRGFPTVVMTDAQGRPFGLNGYQPVSPEKYAEVTLGISASFKDKQESYAAAQSLDGLGKAAKLIGSVPDLPGNLAARYFGPRMKEVVALDPDDELGRTEAYKIMLDDVAYANAMQVLAKDMQWGKMVELTDLHITENKLRGTSLQKALLNKAQVQKKQEDLKGHVETLLEVVKADPDSPLGKEAQKQLDVLRAQKIEETLLP